MECIKYRILISPSEAGTESAREENREERFLDVFLRPASPENILIVQAEAYNGEYEIIDDGEPEPGPTDMETLQLAVAELAAVMEEQNTATQLAIAEAVEAMMGGEE